MQKATILCVDDEVDNVDALERLFRKKYSVLRAYSGNEALSVLKNHSSQIAVIITDQRMPGMSGVEFLHEALLICPETIRMLLTGYTDLESIIDAVNSGQIYRYITKPWDPVDLMNTVDKAAERFQLGLELKQKNIELQAAYNELKSLDQAKSNFMILINHELKTPLTGILSFMELLKETVLNEEQKIYVDRIERSSFKLKSIIDDVLLVVRSEIGQLKINSQQIMTDELGRDLPASIKELLTKKNQNIHRNGPNLKVTGDLLYLQEIFNRLLHNASKFGQEGSQIYIRTEEKSGRAELTIENQGKPIPEVVVDKIFQPFYLDENIMNHSTGIGLGLTICQSLLLLHQSSLNIRNTENGVVVGFSLPTE